MKNLRCFFKGQHEPKLYAESLEVEAVLYRCKHCGRYKVLYDSIGGGWHKRIPGSDLWGWVRVG